MKREELREQIALSHMQAAADTIDDGHLLNDTAYNLADDIMAAVDQYTNQRMAEELDALHADIITVDKYRSENDKQAFAYARVHRLIDDRIATIQANITNKEEE